MFDKLKNLVNQLEINDITKYNQVKNSRAILQQIKVEAQNLRNTITKEFKNSKNCIKHKVSKEEIKDNNLEGEVKEGEEVLIHKKETEFEGKFFSK